MSTGYQKSQPMSSTTETVGCWQLQPRLWAAWYAICNFFAPVLPLQTLLALHVFCYMDESGRNGKAFFAGIL